MAPAAAPVPTWQTWEPRRRPVVYMEPSMKKLLGLD
jgi:hypothetical protein